MAYFLAKTDPDTYSIEDLEHGHVTRWDEVRNAQAVRTIQAMRPADEVLIYHSRGEAAIVGLARVVSEPRPAPNDSKSWVVDVEFVGKLAQPMTLREIKESHRFDDWNLVRQGRLSTMSVPDDFVVWLKDKNAIWYVGGQWVHPNEAVISINDVAVLRGYSVFESLRTYNRRPFHLDEHLARLFRSAELIELEIPWSREEIAEVVREVVVRNVYKHASIRLLIAGGESEDGILPSGKSVLAVLITPLGERDMERFARGCKLITTRLQRESPEAKTTNYMAAVRALKEATRQGAADALFVNEQGHVLEATRSNFFIFRGDTLVTPREGVLIGVTRNVVLELARGRFAIEERPILLNEVPLADEAFITSSSKEITPVVQIDDLVIGDGKPGPRTYKLEQRFVEMVESGEF